MKILVACEFSGVVRDAFMAKGHKAVSCDLLPTESPGPHLQDDVLNHLNDGWDMMIAHPPCTYLSVASAAWLKRRPERIKLMKDAALFFKKLWEADINKICIENPVIFSDAVDIIGSKYSQIIQPYQYGHQYLKRTCLWLKNLPALQPANIVRPDTSWVNSTSNYGKGCRCSNNGRHRNPKERSRTFQGIADAMADQWG